MAPLTDDEQRRVELTTAVRDTDRLPKVDGAGGVEDRDGTRVQVMHNGVLIEEGGYHGDFMTEIIRRLHGHHEPQEETVFAALVERVRRDGDASPAMLELGSFWAYYSLWFKHAVAGARCIMVEPDPHNLEAGRRNFALNGLEGEFHQGVAGREHGATVLLPTESDGAVRPLRAVTVDGLMTEAGVERLDIVLADVQGAELDVLEGAERAIREGAIRFLVVSTHHHAISGDALTHQRCLRRLQDAGAHIVAEHTVYESCSGDGLVVAALDPRDADLRVDVTAVRARDSLFGEPERELARALRLRFAARRAVRAARGRVRALRARSAGAD